MYTLAIPNLEVQLSLMEYIADYISKIDDSVEIENNIYDALLETDFLKLEQNIKSLFASIPYNNFTNNTMYKYEGYYVSVFYSYIKALGINISCEDVTNKGRIDMTIKLPNNIIIIEFKVDNKDALRQIKDKNYHKKYLNDGIPIYLIGIEFSKKDRNISKLEWEKVDTKLYGVTNG
jgi:hypothetical protein